MTESRFYVYAYLRDKDSGTAKAGTPYYIGKGTKNRHISKHGKTPVPNNRKNIIFLEINLTELGAFALERRYIRWYGRKDNNTGILLNHTDGGEGFAYIGKPGKPMSKETRNKISIANSGINNGMYGKIQTEEHRKKNSKSQLGKQGYWLGKVHTEESNLKRSLTMKSKPHIGGVAKGTPQPKLICPHCGQEGGNSGMKRWHFDNCKAKKIKVIL